MELELVLKFCVVGDGCSPKSNTITIKSITIQKVESSSRTSEARPGASRLRDELFKYISIFNKFNINSSFIRVSFINFQLDDKCTFQINAQIAEDI